MGRGMGEVMTKVIFAEDGLYYPCSECGVVKPKSEFPRNRARSYGFDTICKECRKRIMKEHRYKVYSEISKNPDDPRHGRVASYNAGCRCDKCRYADYAYRRAYRARKKALA